MACPQTKVASQSWKLGKPNFDLLFIAICESLEMLLAVYSPGVSVMRKIMFNVDDALLYAYILVSWPAHKYMMPKFD